MYTLEVTKIILLIDVWNAQVTEILRGEVREVVIMVKILGETINSIR